MGPAEQGVENDKGNRAACFLVVALGGFAGASRMYFQTLEKIDVNP